jgi:hypothetical protein
MRSSIVYSARHSTLGYQFRQQDLLIRQGNLLSPHISEQILASTACGTSVWWKDVKIQRRLLKDSWSLSLKGEMNAVAKTIDTEVKLTWSLKEIIGDQALTQL